MSFTCFPIMNLLVTSDCKFHADKRYTDNEIKDMINKTLEEYQKFIPKTPPREEMENRLAKSMETLVQSIQDGLKLLDRNHSSMMIFVIKNCHFRLFKSNEWIVTEDPPKPQPGTWGYSP